MFAVVILGIGFIMVAAIFPVTIKMSQTTGEEAVTASVARGGVAFAEQVSGKTVTCYHNNAPVDMSLMYATDLSVGVTSGANGLRPARALAALERADELIPSLNVPGSISMRGKVLALGDLRVYQSYVPGDDWWPLQDTAIREMSGNVIVPTDSRFAWVPVFKRDRTYSTRGESAGAGPAAPAGSSIAINDTNYVINLEDAPAAQLILFGVQIRNRTNFSQVDLPRTRNGSSPPPIKQYNLQPRPVAVRIYQPSGETGYVAEFYSAKRLNGYDPRGGYPTGTAVDNMLDAAPQAVGEGTYFVISDDRIFEPLANRGLMNGRIFRVGVQRTDLAPSSGVPDASVWDLFPGFEFTPDPGNDGVMHGAATDDILAIGVSTSVNNAVYKSDITVDGASAGMGALALIIGRGLNEDYINSTNPNDVPAFDGAPMDVSVYTTFVQAK